MQRQCVSRTLCSPSPFLAVHDGGTLPTYFPSVSSVKTALSPLSYVQVLNLVFAGNRFLLSAFDVIRTDEETQAALLKERERAAKTGTQVLMDSGNYESYWRAPSKRWRAQEFHHALRLVKPDIAFGFDIQDPPPNEEKHFVSMLAQLDKDRAAASTSLMIPIVHGDPDRLSNLCPRMVREAGVKAIAVPERCLGAGLFERRDAVSTIRRELNDTGDHVVLHLLGTGNPLSLALLSEAGADSFDGLEWCQTAVDCQSALLHHFSQGDLFLSQGRWAESSASFPVKVLAHNLDFYSNWMSRVKEAIAAGAVRELVRQVFPPQIFDRCVKAQIWDLGS
jgi:hypothetical protein